LSRILRKASMCWAETQSTDKGITTSLCSSGYSIYTRAIKDQISICQNVINIKFTNAFPLFK
jgi:hypothetical protein